MATRKWRRLRLLPQLVLSFGAGFTLSFILFSLLATDTADNNRHHGLVAYSPAVPEPAAAAAEATNNPSHLMVAVIFSSVRNIARRNTIRNTWVLLAEKLSFKYYFIIGTEGLSSSQVMGELIAEQKQNDNDLVLLPQLSDTYHNLTLKLLQTFQWVDANVRYRYLLKVDDDSFVRIDALYQYLKQNDTGESKPLYWGFFDGRAHVKQRGVWKEKNWFLCDRYLPYALGGGYVLSADLVHFVARHASRLQRYRSEDVSLGTWLAPLAIERRHDIRFDTEYKSRGCHNSFLVQHKQSSVDMESKYDSLIKYGRLCSRKEYETRPVYHYNWHVLPSKCCVRNVTMISTSLKKSIN